jgi:transcriptional regulator with XRE-family HTH domain
MILQDRKRLARLMVIQGVTQRELAEAADWKAHSIVTRLLNGKLKTVTPERAVRIAHHLGVGVDDLFLTRVDSVPGGTDHRSGRAA